MKKYKNYSVSEVASKTGIVWATTNVQWIKECMRNVYNGIASKCSVVIVFRVRQNYVILNGDKGSWIPNWILEQFDVENF